MALWTLPPPPALVPYYLLEEEEEVAEARIPLYLAAPRRPFFGIDPGCEGRYWLPGGTR